MKVLVTGGGGFVGSYVVDELLKQNTHVRVLCRGTYPELQKKGVEIVQGDISNPRTVDQACQDTDTVFHIAAKVGVFGPDEEFYKTNVLGTQNIIRSCQAFRIGRLVYCSSSSVVYGGKDQINVDETAPYPASYLSPYSQTKALAEKMVLEANGKKGLLTVAIRPHLVWGPRDRYIIPKILHMAKKRRLRIVGDGKNKTDISYVENVAKAHVLAAQHLKYGSQVPGNAYFITQGKPVFMWEWINQVLELFDLPPVTKHMSPKLAYPLGQF
ncbi:MAG: 3-beta hydroxysteroid dehydrogenase, partial [Deltaproteobacteria bacterium RIFCSPHIGHO2_02_FULL_40_11]